MFRKWLFAWIVFFCYSCSGIENEITYFLNGIKIIRIDKSGETSFYYQRQNQERSVGRIVVRYSGINDGFSGYLKFENNGYVVLLSGDGYFQSEDLDAEMFSYRRITARERPQLDSSVYYITLSTRHEVERNSTVKSKIKAEYKDL